jgi:hypothetical protein
MKQALTFCIFFVFAAALAVFITGCARPPDSGGSGISGRHSIAVMPVIKGRDPRDLDQTLSCPFAGFCYEKTELKPEADRIMTEILHEKLMNRLEDRVYPLALVREIYPALRIRHQNTNPLDMAVKLGMEVGVDYVAVCNVWRYQERVGSSLGVAEPASVAFNLYLVAVKEEKPVWSGRFNETQQSLSENLLKAPSFFRRGARWLTARELARHGIDALLKEFPLR